MDSTDIKDKLVLDPTDSAALHELFSRKDPGDEFEFHGRGTLDEAGSKVIVLSLTHIEFKDKGDDVAITPKRRKKSGEENGEETGGAAVEMFKNQDGVPVQEGTHEGDNVPPETQPPAAGH